jgi:hypothetical protein
VLLMVVDPGTEGGGRRVDAEEEREARRGV